MLLLTVIFNSQWRHYIHTGDVISDVVLLMSILHRKVNVFAKNRCGIRTRRRRWI